MKPFTLALILIGAIMAIILGFSVMPPAPDKSDGLAIDADRNLYITTMSSTVGIGLTPAYPSSVDNRTVIFLWQTDYGHFLRWDAPDYNVSREGSMVYMDDRKIYWSYVADDGKMTRAQAHVALTMIDRASGAALGNASLEIARDDRGYAVIRA